MIATRKNSLPGNEESRVSRCRGVNYCDSNKKKLTPDRRIIKGFIACGSEFLTNTIYFNHRYQIYRCQPLFYFVLQISIHILIPDFIRHESSACCPADLRSACHRLIVEAPHLEVVLAVFELREADRAGECCAA